MNKELPKLNGASKQITWAEQIRETILEQLSDEKKQLALTLQMCEHASWWINSRFTLTSSIEAGLEYASLILKKIPVLEQIAEESKETNQDKANFMLKKRRLFLLHYDTVATGQFLEGFDKVLMALQLQDQFGFMPSDYNCEALKCMLPLTK